MLRVLKIRRIVLTRLVALVAFACTWALSAAAEERRTVSPREAEDAQGYKVASLTLRHAPEERIRSRELLAAMQTQVGSRFQRRFFFNDLRLLENLHRSAGYMDTEIVRKRLEVDEDDKLHLRIDIDSKNQWTISDVQLEVAGAVETKELQGILEIEAGDRFRYGDIMQTERDLQTHLNRQGFAHATVSHELNLGLGGRFRFGYLPDRLGKADVHRCDFGKTHTWQRGRTATHEHRACQALPDLR